jgi:hypothetical protein
MKEWKIFEVRQGTNSLGNPIDCPGRIEDKLNEVAKDGWNIFKLLNSGYRIIAWKEKSIQTPEKEASHGY